MPAVGEFSEAGFVMADLAVLEADLAASRGLDIVGTGLLRAMDDRLNEEDTVVRSTQSYTVPKLVRRSGLL